LTEPAASSTVSRVNFCKGEYAHGDEMIVGAAGEQAREDKRQD
jgi:hypothetical protein